MELEPIAVPPPPPIVAPVSHIPHIIVVSPAIGQYVMPSLGMPVYTPTQGGAVCDYFLKNGGQLFYGSINHEVAIRVVLHDRQCLVAHGSSPKLWVQVATEAMHRMGKIWLKSSHSTYLQSR